MGNFYSHKKSYRSLPVAFECFIFYEVGPLFIFKAAALIRIFRMKSDTFSAFVGFAFLFSPPR